MQEIRIATGYKRGSFECFLLREMPKEAILCLIWFAPVDQQLHIKKTVIVWPCHMAVPILDSPISGLKEAEETTGTLIPKLMATHFKCVTLGYVIVGDTEP
jgi:hypothetical protein